MSTEQLKQRLVLEPVELAILGSEFVNEKLIGIVHKAVEMEEDVGLLSLVFRNDGFPTKVLGMAYPDVNGIAINLDYIWERSIEIAKEENCLSLRAILWINLLSTLLHDLHHIQSGNIDREALEISRDKNGDGELDAEADEFAKMMLVRLAAQYDIEPPVMADLPYFATKLMELTTGEDKDANWVRTHVSLMEAGMIYHDPKPKTGRAVEIISYREYLKQTMDLDELKFPGGVVIDWDQPTTPISMIMTKENGQVEAVSAEPVESVLPDVEAEEEAEVVVAYQAANDQAAAVGEPGVSINSDQTEEPAVEVIAEIQAETDGMDQAAVEAVVAAGQGVVATALFAPDMPATNPVYPDQPAMDPKTAGIPPEAAAFIGPAAAANMQVPIPAATQAIQDTAAVAANMQVPTPEPITTYQDNGIAPDVFKAAMCEIYQICYHHIFTKCDRQQNSDVGFTAPANVLTPVHIGGVLQRYGITNLVMSYDTMDAQGQYSTEKCDGALVRGTIMKKTNLPAFDLFVNFAGHRLGRRLVPQNPAKINKDGSGYTKSAQKARDGHAVMWIIDRDNDVFKAAIEDNIYREL